jgi:hypothetical protein
MHPANIVPVTPFRLREPVVVVHCAKSAGNKMLTLCGQMRKSKAV